jgi:hypothetical protein
MLDLMTTGISPAIDNSPIEEIDPPVQKKAGKMRKRKSVVIEEVRSSPEPTGEPTSIFAFHHSHFLQTSMISPPVPQPLPLPLLLLLQGLMQANAESALSPVLEKVSFFSGSKDASLISACVREPRCRSAKEEAEARRIRKFAREGLRH